MDANSGMLIDPNTGMLVDPNTGDVIDPSMLGAGMPAPISMPSASVPRTSTRTGPRVMDTSPRSYPSLRASLPLSLNLFSGVSIGAPLVVRLASWAALSSQRHLAFQMYHSIPISLLPQLIFIYLEFEFRVG